MSESFDLPEADWTTVGTVGPPGQRTFYLQARQEGRVVTLKLEKQQVAALSTLLAELLADLAATPEVPDDEQLELVDPVEAEWTVGGMQLAYDEDADRVVLLAEEASDNEDDPTAVGRLSISRAFAAALARRGEELVASGRPACPLCGYPMDPAGHSCPRTNGHRAP
ncbi:MAG: DUF3090 family protein, partial [Acidimicrobiaceae bacterium]|nr:DUF3090 family protein [Acidimicrobiaceae bacterium]